MRTGGTASPPSTRATPEVIVHTDDSQPVEPAPVETMTPDEDCRSQAASGAARHPQR